MKVTSGKDADIKRFDMPATQEKVWRALTSAAEIA